MYITKTENNYIKKAAIFIFLIVSYTENMHEKLFPSNSIKLLFLILPIVLLLLDFIMVNRNIALMLSPGQIGWLIILIFSMCSNSDIYQGNYGIILRFSLAIAVTWILGQTSDWHETALTILSLFTLIHALGTILIFMFPNLYDLLVRPLMTSATLVGAGYKAGLTGHYSTNGMYLGIGCVVSFSVLLYSEKKRWLALLSFLLTTFALFLTTKRAQCLFAALVICIAYYCYCSNRKRSRWFKVAFFIGGLSLLFILVSSVIPEISTVVERFLNPEGGDVTNGRIPNYQLAWELFCEHPFLGIGWGGYKYMYYSHGLYLAYPGTTFYMLDAHNVYLQVLCEGGIFVFLLFVYVVFGTGYKTFKLLSILRQDAASKRREQCALTVSLSIQCFFLMYCMTGNPLYDVQCLFPYSIACAIYYSLAAQNKREEMELYRENRNTHLSPR